MACRHDECPPDWWPGASGASTAAARDAGRRPHRVAHVRFGAPGAAERGRLSPLHGTSAGSVQGLLEELSHPRRRLAASASTRRRASRTRNDGPENRVTPLGGMISDRRVGPKNVGALDFVATGMPRMPKLRSTLRKSQAIWRAPGAALRFQYVRRLLNRS
jgi:hypothetical protein